MQAGHRAEPASAALGSAGLHPAVLSTAAMLGRGWQGAFAHQQVSLLLSQELTQLRLMGHIPGIPAPRADSPGLHKLPAPSCRDAHTEKSSACSWQVHLGIILLNKKTVMAQQCPVPVPCLSEPQPLAGPDVPHSSPMPRALQGGTLLCTDTPGTAWSSSDTARKERGKAGPQCETHPAG